MDPTEITSEKAVATHGALSTFVPYQCWNSDYNCQETNEDTHQIIYQMSDEYIREIHYKYDKKYWIKTSDLERNLEII
jgi:hypothetical protein